MVPTALRCVKPLPDSTRSPSGALAQPHRFDGLSQADSISLDAHKRLYQPLDCSILLYPDADVARRTFAYSAAYVKTTTEDPIEGFAFFARLSSSHEGSGR
jgi:aromatic-L-amino-acid/L-tryptophan decarboxylase